METKAPYKKKKLNPLSDAAICKRFAECIEAYRVREGLNYREVSASMGVDYNHMNAAKLGLKPVTMGMITNSAARLGFNANYILAGTGDLFTYAGELDSEANMRAKLAHMASVVKELQHLVEKESRKQKTKRS